VGHKTDSDALDTKGDWRLQGQDRYLMNARLMLSEYKGSSCWDHDHCVFCFAKFSDSKEDLHYGYCTFDRHHWICEDCFEDFKDMFKWRYDRTERQNEAG
jgi:hypothetical protein